MYIKKKLKYPSSVSALLHMVHFISRYTFSPLTSCLLARILEIYWLLFSHYKVLLDSLVVVKYLKKERKKKEKHN